MTVKKTAAAIASAKLKIALSKLLWAELERLDIDRGELARRSGLSDQTVRDVLAGMTDPSLSRTLAIERGLGRPAGWIGSQVG